MKEMYLKSKNYKLSISENVHSPLMVCSHERSGTHFLMNSIDNASHYTSNPYLNFDLDCAGAIVNLFSETNVSYFLKQVSSFQENGKNYCMNSIIKSHFPIELMQKGVSEGLKVAYIFRDPYKVFISYWNLIHALEWFEAPRTISPLGLAIHIPCGKSQRYQIQNYSSYFERWAMHLSSAHKLSKKFPNIQLVYYDDLLNNFNETMESLLSFLSIEMIDRPSIPSKENQYVKGRNKKPSQEQSYELKEFCNLEVKKYPDLPSLILNQVK